MAFYLLSNQHVWCFFYTRLLSSIVPQIKTLTVFGQEDLTLQ